LPNAINIINDKLPKKSISTNLHRRQSASLTIKGVFIMRRSLAFFQGIAPCGQGQQLYETIFADAEKVLQQRGHSKREIIDSLAGLNQFELFFMIKYLDRDLTWSGVKRLAQYYQNIKQRTNGADLLDYASYPERNPDRFISDAYKFLVQEKKYSDDQAVDTINDYLTKCNITPFRYTNHIMDYAEFDPLCNQMIGVYSHYLNTYKEKVSAYPIAVHPLDIHCFSDDPMFVSLMQEAGEKQLSLRTAHRFN